MDASSDIKLANTIALYFLPSNYNLKIKSIHSGIINKTFLVLPFKSKEFAPFILQKVSSIVFSNPIDLISNYLILEEYIDSNNSFTKKHLEPSIVFPKLLVNLHTYKKFLIHQGKLWRAFDYLPNTISYDVTPSPVITFNLFRGLSEFHSFTSNIRSESLLKVIPNFHNTPLVSSLYTSKLHSFISSKKDLKDYSYLLQLVEIVKKQEPNFFLLERSKSLSTISHGIIHGDPKINNFLFDFKTNKFVSLIDLDTLQEGLILYDIADCLRSCCNPLGEETDSIEEVEFSFDSYQQALLGYLSYRNKIVTKNDITLIPASIKIITYELALRFLIDYMNGNIYFNSTYENQNLDRANIQLRLLASINDQLDSIVSFTNSLISTVF